jgi:hypothetical protein
MKACESIISDVVEPAQPKDESRRRVLKFYTRLLFELFLHKSVLTVFFRASCQYKSTPTAGVNGTDHIQLFKQR